MVIGAKKRIQIVDMLNSDKSMGYDTMKQAGESLGKSESWMSQRFKRGKKKSFVYAGYKITRLW